MPRQRPPYGVPGYRRGTGMKVGRASRRHRSFWRTYVLTPLVALVVLGAAGLAAAVVVNLVTMPSARQALSSHGAGGTRTAAGGGASGTRTASGASTTAKTAKTANTAKTGQGASAAGTSGAGSGARGKARGKTTAATAKGKGKTSSGNTATKPGAAAGSGSRPVLVRSAPGVDTYVAAHGPLVATLHVAWRSWVRVLADGRLAFLREENTGFTRTYRGKTSLDVYLGYAQGSRLTVNGTTLGPFSGKSTLWIDITAKRGA